jgi:YesN/AraC family two-component response regulator
MVRKLYESQGLGGIEILLEKKVVFLKNSDISLNSVKIELIKLSELLIDNCFPVKKNRKLVFFVSLLQCQSRSELLEEFNSHFIEFIEDNETKLLIKIKELLNIMTFSDIKNVNVDYLANKLGANRSYISNLFFAKEGVKLSEYIREKKINLAYKMLTAGKNTLKPTAVCKALGFSNYSDFKKAFENIYIMSPMQFFESSKK